MGPVFLSQQVMFVCPNDKQECPNRFCLERTLWQWQNDNLRPAGGLGLFAAARQLLLIMTSNSLNTLGPQAKPSADLLGG